MNPPRDTVMTETIILSPRDRRSAAFFWLGVGILPVFWSWFTMGRQFQKWQRHLALGWLLVVLGMVVSHWAPVEARLEMLALTFPIIPLCVTCGLFAWLFLRIAEMPLPFQVLVFGVLSHSYLVISTLDRLAIQPFAWAFAFLPIVPAFLHLALRRERLWNGKVEWHFQWNWWE
jgi:hypothetical protein